MLDKLLNVAVKKYGLDKYVSNVGLKQNSAEFKLTLSNDEGKSFTLYFDVQPEYRDEVELVLSLFA